MKALCCCMKKEKQFVCSDQIIFDFNAGTLRTDTSSGCSYKCSDASKSMPLYSNLTFHLNLWKHQWVSESNKKKKKRMPDFPEASVDPIVRLWLKNYGFVQWAF